MSLREFYSKVEHKIKWQEYAGQGKQSGLQYQDDEDPFTSATGVARSRDILFKELNSLYEGSIIEDIIQEYNCTRLRWMWMDPKSCYTYHKDQTPRIHIPIITNPDNLFIFEDTAPFHLGAGHVYWVDTRKKHTFANCSNQQRLHLVGAVKD
jgi:hypothetical protein